MEKTSLPFPAAAPTPRQSWKPRIALGILAGLAAYHLIPSHAFPKCLHRSREYTLGSKELDLAYFEEHVKCPIQPKPLYPKHVWNMTQEEKDQSMKIFSEAVQIPTESFDDNGEPNEDPRWKPFFDFQKWLKQTFPLAHEKATVEYVNTLGIVATFKGSDESLKPLVL
jgi:Gly-Xaa carboxypeptidase